MSEAFGNVIDIFTKREKVKIGDSYYIVPRSREEYLFVCRNTLSEPIYRCILCGIMDDEYYGALAEEHRKIVDCYYSFPS